MNSVLTRTLSVAALSGGAICIGLSLFGTTAVSATTLIPTGSAAPVIQPIADGSNVILLQGRDTAYVYAVDGALRSKAAAFAKQSAEASFDR